MPSSLVEHMLDVTAGRYMMTLSRDHDVFLIPNLPLLSSLASIFHVLRSCSVNIYILGPCLHGNSVPKLRKLNPKKVISTLMEWGEPVHGSKEEIMSRYIYIYIKNVCVW